MMFYNRILIIDNDDLLRNIMKIIMQKLTHAEVVSANSGESGIEELKKEKVDIIFVDYNMPPGMNGLETSIEIRKIQPSVIIIMVTGKHMDEKCMGEINKVVNAFFPKPVTPQKLLKEVQPILVEYAMHVMSGETDKPLDFRIE